MPQSQNNRRRTTPRDSRGRFQPGGAGGPGNPRVRRMADLQTAIAKAVDPRMTQALMKRLVKQAIDGPANEYIRRHR